MEDFLGILRMKPSVKDGTEDLIVPAGAHAGVHRATAPVTMRDTDSQPADSSRGLSVEFKDVAFSYTEDRPVGCYHRAQECCALR